MSNATDAHNQQARKPAISCLAWLNGATVRRMPNADRLACAVETVLIEYPMAIMQDMASNAQLLIDIGVCRAVQRLRR